MPWFVLLVPRIHAQDSSDAPLAAEPVWEQVGSRESGWAVAGTIPAGLDPSRLMDGEGNMYRLSAFGTSGEEDEIGATGYRSIAYYPALDVSGAHRNRADHESNAPDPLDSQGPDVSALTDAGVYEVHLRREPLKIPRSAKHLLPEDPLVALEAELERIEAIERRKTDVADDQAALRAEILDRGLTAGRALWTSNSFLVELVPEDAEWLAEQAEIAYVVRYRPLEEDGTTGDEIRVGHQIEQFIDQGFDGETTFSNSIWPDVMIAIIDSSIDSDHVAWLDGSGTASRLKEMWCWEPDGLGSFELVEGSSDCESTSITSVPSSYGSSLTTARSHGTWVASQALADVSDGQVSGETADWIARRQGMTEESSFIFIDAFGYKNDVRGNEPSLQTSAEAIEIAIDREVDIINLSLGAANGGQGASCDAWTTASSLAANAAAEVGIVVVAAAGNNGNNFSPCTVLAPAGAPGSISVGALEHAKASDPEIDPKTASVAGYSSRGSDVYGREVVTVVATGGRSNHALFSDGTLADYTGAWSGWSVEGTSFAAPVVTGGIANLIDHGLTEFGNTLTGGLGVMQALTMLMADGMGTNATSISSTFGAGRLKMRTFNAAGLDSPHGDGLEQFFICEGDTITLPVNPVMSVNTALSSDSETLRVAAWWYEPNASRSTSTTNGVANIGVALRTTSGSETHTASTGSSGHKVIRVGADHGNTAAGKTWEIRVTGTDIPTAQDWLPLDCRLLAVAWYFEDDDRDDSDGKPAADIE